MYGLSQLNGGTFEPWVCGRSQVQILEVSDWVKGYRSPRLTFCTYLWTVLFHMWLRALKQGGNLTLVEIVTSLCDYKLF